jgi:hypothetical protein
MFGRVRSLLVAGLLVAACGDSGPAQPPTGIDVKGTPFLVTRTAEPAVPDVAIGDVDAPREGDQPPLPPPSAVEPPAEPPPVPAPAPSPPSAPPAAGEDGEFEPVSFDELASFTFTQYASGEKHEVPAKILALSGKRIAVDGYVMPLSYEAGGAKKFLLMRYRFGCCYSVPPMLNEWIEVTMAKGVADYIPDTLSTVSGVLTVKEETKDGAATGLYTMLASRSEFTEAR